MKKTCFVVLSVICILLMVGCNNGNLLSNQNGQDYFNAAILEIHDSYVLVECLEKTSGAITSGTELSVSTEVVAKSGAPEMNVGDNIRVVFSGVMETDPPQLQTVFAIYLLDEQGEVIPND